MDEKKNMRADVLGRRDALDAQTRAHKSATICRALERLVEEACAPVTGTGRTCPPAGDSAEANQQGPTHEVRTYRNFGRPPCIAVYAAMRSEVNLQAFVHAAFARGWDVCFPCMVRAGADDRGPSRMAFYRVPRERLDQARTAFLDSPLRCLPCAALSDGGYEEAEPADLDAVAVPLVAFDDAGNRLGYGGGNYDQLLPRLRADAVVIGIAFDEQRVETVPCEPHDIALPRVVSG